MVLSFLFELKCQKIELIMYKSVLTNLFSTFQWDQGNESTVGPCSPFFV